MYKKQTSVSYGSTESEIISLEEGLRLDGDFPLSNCGISLFQSLETQFRPTIQRGNPLSTVTKITGSNKRSQGMISHQEALLYVFEDNEAVIKMTIKGKKSRQWDMFPRPTELHLIGYSIESIWTQKSKSSRSRPNTQLPEILTKGISHVTNGIICCVCSISAISVPQFVLKRWQKVYNKIQEKSESQRNRDKWWALLQKATSNLSPSTSEGPGKRNYGNQDPWSAKAEKEAWKYLSLIGDERVFKFSTHEGLSLFRFCVVSLGRSYKILNLTKHGIRWDTREFHRKDYIHVDVQRHLLWIKRQLKRMRVKCQSRFSICEKIWSRTMVISRTWSEKKWYSISEDGAQGEWDNLAEKMLVEFAESGHPTFRATSPLLQRSAQKQRPWKIVDTLLCRFGDDSNCFSHNYFL